MKDAKDIESKEPAARQVPVVAVPAEVFQDVIDKLATQPYNNVGPLINKLLTYEPQLVPEVLETTELK